ncbi:putative disease resistance protein RGA1 [Papaver somniferum]|uniref:putative disease resistance protein RGA1 n=1 Tax=Papaver somniferum TaxID=3469 RepID=UPI000E7055F1|nr:putative disease resistance protein RGA1 [Papaver somniferum]
MAASTILQVLASPLLGTVFDSLRSLVETEFSLISGVNGEFNILVAVLSTMKDVIEDAEVKQLTEKPIRNWLRKIKDVTYDVEDFLEECKTDAVLRRSPQLSYKHLSLCLLLYVSKGLLDEKRRIIFLVDGQWFYAIKSRNNGS